MDPDHPSYVLGFAFGLVLLISCNILSQNCTAKRELSALAVFFACLKNNAPKHSLLVL